MASLSTTIKKWVSRTFDKPLAQITIDEGWGVPYERRERWVFYQPLDKDFLHTEAFVYVKLSVKKRRLQLLRNKKMYYDGIHLGVWKPYNPDELPRLEINVEARPRGFIR